MRFGYSVGVRELVYTAPIWTYGALALLEACSSAPSSDAPVDAGYVDVQDTDAGQARVDGGFAGPDGAVLRDDRFVTKVESFTPGTCAGFGAAQMPGIVEGPPIGGGQLKGSLDVVSLGVGGEIVLSFGSNAILDGPGTDFIVFENAFFAGGDSSQPVVDLGEVSVSEDGSTWKTFPCEPGAGSPTGTYGTCAGWHPVLSAPNNGISPLDPKSAGGDPFDLSMVGLATARFVRIRDKSTGTCDGQPKPNNAGFDLDAIAIVNAEQP